MNLSDQIALSEIATKHSTIGCFKSTVKFKQSPASVYKKEFYGQKIKIDANPKVDEILIGVTNNLISRLEIWNNNQLVETSEIGFTNKMTWGATQTMSVAFTDQTNTKYPGKSKIIMRFYKGSGFFGDIGILYFDLTKYGDLSGNKEIKMFSKSLESKKVNEPEFSDLKIWKNYQSFN